MLDRMYNAWYTECIDQQIVNVKEIKVNGIIALHEMRKERIPELVEQVGKNELTAEEAAKCLAGAQLKVYDEYAPRPADASLLRRSLHDIESRLPDYTGIVIGRHI